MDRLPFKVPLGQAVHFAAGLFFLRTGDGGCPGILRDLNARRAMGAMPLLRTQWPWSGMGHAWSIRPHSAWEPAASHLAREVTAQSPTRIVRAVGRPGSCDCAPALACPRALVVDGECAAGEYDGAGQLGFPPPNFTKPRRALLRDLDCNDARRSWPLAAGNPELPVLKCWRMFRSGARSRFAINQACRAGFLPTSPSRTSRADLRVAAGPPDGKKARCPGRTYIVVERRPPDGT